MKKLIFIVLLLAATASFGQYESCRYKMVAPVTSENLTFSDTVIKIDFTILPTSLKFVILNNADCSISVLWSECSVSINQATSKVVHNGISFDKKDDQPSTRIPPGGMILDFVVPVSKIYSDNSGSYGVLPLVYPYVGCEVSFFMVLKANGEELEYNFKFVVTEVLK
jgi:hypothetical protein